MNSPKLNSNQKQFLRFSFITFHNLPFRFFSSLCRFCNWCQVFFFRFVFHQFQGHPSERNDKIIYQIVELFPYIRRYLHKNVINWIECDMRFINALDLHKYYSNFNSFLLLSFYSVMCHLDWIPTWETWSIIFVFKTRSASFKLMLLLSSFHEKLIYI